MGHAEGVTERRTACIATPLAWQPQVGGWRVFIDEPRSAAEQMAYDEALARDAVPAVRLFRWDPPAVSLGWKQPLPGWVREAGVPWVERPTGGGIAFHGSDVSVAMVVPRASQRSVAAMMEAVCETAVQVCAACGVTAVSPAVHPAGGRITYCLAEPGPYAVLVGGRKVAGFALRRYPESWLIQGSLLVGPLPAALHRALPGGLLRQLETRAVPLASAATEPVTDTDVMDQWSHHLSALPLGRASVVDDEQRLAAVGSQRQVVGYDARA